MLNQILNIGAGALRNAQSAITVYGDNVANAATEGYCRRTVTTVNTDPITVSGLCLGTGADIESVTRMVSGFVERQWLGANSAENYWSARTESLYSVESLFDEDDAYGVSTALTDFWAGINNLTEYPDSTAAREEMLATAQTLASTLATLAAGLNEAQEALEDAMADAVAEANELIKGIAAVNAEIVGHADDASLADERDQLVRELSTLVDVQVQYNDDGTVTVSTAEGQTLAEGAVARYFGLEGPGTEAVLLAGSTFDGQVYFQGEHNGELVLDFLTDGTADGTAGAATYRLSLDGGETWVSDENGAPIVYTAAGSDDPVTVEGVTFWFGTAADPTATPSTSIMAGDRFEITAKSTVEWYRTTSDSVNVTPLDGADTRLTGGTLAGLATARDSVIQYGKELDALAQELAWQINYAYSQGASTTPLTYSLANIGVNDATIPLADTDLTFADRMTTGNLSLAIFDESTGESLGVSALDFSSVTPGQSSFDPAVHSLSDVAQAVNDTFAGQVTATINNGQLVLTAASGYAFSFAGDSTGLLAATGTNVLLTGDDASSLGVDPELAADSSLVNVGAVNAEGVVEASDNTVAQLLSDLQSADVTLAGLASHESQTLSEHFNALAALVGQDVDQSARQYAYAEVLATDLNDRREEISGVNLDEELTQITRWQQAYEAAAQLIQTAQEMFDVILSLKS